MRCPECDGENVETLNFCGHCGAPLKEGVELPPIRSGDPLIGQVIADRYRLLELIGRGGMGVVYKVEHTGMGKLMAMKLLHGELSRDREIVKRFKREAQAASMLKHINTVSIFDFGRADGLMYLTMEYIDGIDLGRTIRGEGPMPFVRLAGVLVQACGSLAEAHEVGIVHRDLKPENVLVCQRRDQRDFVKVLDFGLAKLRETEHQMEITSQGSLIGTPYYMAPEQIRGESVDGRADIYALGALLYKAVSGSPPFSAATPVGVLTRHLTDPVPKLAERFADLAIPPEADEIVARAMAKDKADRYRSVEEMRDDLLDYLHRTVGEGASSDAWRLLTPVTGRGSPRRNTGSTTVPAPDEAVPVARTDRAYEVATRAEFDRYEKRILRGRYAVWVALMFLLLAGGGAAAYGFVRRADLIRPTHEQEPNDTQTKAVTLLPGESLDGSLGQRISKTESDRDWWRFQNPGGRPRVLYASVSAIPNMDLVLELYEPGSTEPVARADASGVGEGEALANMRVSAHAYLLLVREVWFDGRPPTENVSDTYRVQFRLTPPSPLLEVEPNDDLERANPIVFDTPLLGYVASARDLDHFCLESVPPGRVSADVSGVEGVDLRLRVVDRDRSESRIEDDGRAGEGESVTFDVRAGVRPPCFEVGGPSDGAGAAGNAFTAYTLHVRRP